MTTDNNPLPEPLKEFIEKCESEARLEGLLVKGLASGGEDIPLNPAFWKDLRAEAMDLANDHRARRR